MKALACSDDGGGAQESRREVALYVFILLEMMVNISSPAAG